MRIDISYDYLTRHIVPDAHGPSFFVALAALPIALLIPRKAVSRRLSTLIFVPIISVAICYSCYRTNGLDVISVDTLLWAIFLLALRDPWVNFKSLDTSKLFVQDRSFKRHDRVSENPSALTDGKHGADGGEQKIPVEVKGASRPPGSPRKKVTFRPAETSYPEDFKERLCWVATLLVSIRLTNWKIGSASHDKGQPPTPPCRTRRAFVALTITSFVRGYLILDLTSAYISHDAFFTDLTVPITAPLPLPLRSYLSYLPPHLVRTAITGIQAYALVGDGFYLPCLIPVTMNYLGLLDDVWSPHTWPAYFGSPWVVLEHGLRGFWGKFWHQTMRWSVAGPGYALSDSLGWHAGMKRYAAILLSAFFFSGVVHMGLVPPEPLYTTMPPNRVRLLIAGFFWSQPVGILLEMLVAKMAVKCCRPGFWDSGNGRTVRIFVNLAWTIAWMGSSGMLFSEAQRNLGYSRVWPVPISLWKGCRNEGWVAWPFLLQ